MRHLTAGVAILSLSLLTTALLPQNSHALELDSPCPDVEIIFAGGSGRTIHDDQGEAAEYFEQIENRITSPISHNTYELGAEEYNGYSYPAVAVGGWSFLTGIGASIGSGNYYTYGNSVKEGVNELQLYLTQRHTKCMDSDTLYILGGYSQGAQVIGQALPKLNKNIRDDIVYTALFGDPKLHYPEGEGWNPPACRGVKSAWREVPIFNCNHDDGSLVARRPYLPSDMVHKTGLWCYAKDVICDPGAIFQLFGPGHEGYKKEYMAIHEAARKAVENLQLRLKQDNPPPPPPLPWQPTPEPPINYDQALNTRRYFNEGTNGENAVFAIDVSESMRYELPKIKQFLREKIPEIVARNGKVAVAIFLGVNEPPYGFRTELVGIPFEADPQIILDHLDEMVQPHGPSPGSWLEATYGSLTNLSWTNGATKSLTIYTNNTDPYEEYSWYQEAFDLTTQTSLEIDPVNIYPVVPEALKDSYTEIAEKTSGQVVTYTSDITEAANQAFDKITNRPVPFLGNLEYMAEPGQEITFDASDSYVIDGEITKYEWDYNGDGDFEATTTNPIIKHTYNSDFTGHMQVQISASNGTLANMSAKVVIGEMTPPTLPAAPQNLTHTITSTTDNKSTVTINWEPNTEAHAWFIQFNDMPMGYVEAGRTSLEITDIERTEDVVIGVASAVGTSANSFNTSPFTTTTVPKIAPPTPEEPPVTSTCSQSNFIIKLLCKAIAIFKYYWNGLWHYILPYKL